MMAWTLLLIAAAVAGLLIGTVGVGGILLIPALAYFAHLPIQAAMATALFTFIFTGVAGAWQFQRRGSIDWRIAWPVNLGALPAGFLGARCNALMDARWLTLILALVILLAGLYTFYASRKSPAHAHSKPAIGTMGLFLAGAGVGFCSGLTGVGGPVIAVPLLVILGFAPLPAIAASQVLQIVAGLSGTLGNLMSGRVDFSVAGSVAICEVGGVFAGAWLAHHANVQQLRLLVAAVCVMVGGGLMLRAWAGY